MFRRGRPLVVLGRYLGCRIYPLALIARDNLAKQAVALAVSVRPGAIEKVATQIDSQLQRLERLFIFGTTPFTHSPKPDTNVTDLPACATKRAVLHGVSCATAWPSKYISRVGCYLVARGKLAVELKELGSAIRLS